MKDELTEQETLDRLWNAFSDAHFASEGFYPTPGDSRVKTLFSFFFAGAMHEANWLIANTITPIPRNN